jgi:predicted nuclease with TOPRIM domain
MSEKKNNKKSIVILLAVVTVLLLIGNVAQFKMNTDTVEAKDFSLDSLYSVNTDINTELIETQHQIERYKGENAQLDSMLSKKEALLIERKNEINALIKSGKTDAKTIAALRSVQRKLKEENKGLLEEIDKFIMENQTLKEENQVLYNTVSTLESEKSALNNQVNIASVLKAEYVKVKALKSRMFSDEKKATSLARRATEFEVCMNLLENKVAKPGTKKVYVAIIADNDKVVGNKGLGSGTFNNGEEEIFFTMSREVEFDGTTVEDVCLNFEETEAGKFKEGTYVVKIYVDKVLTKITSIELK